MSPSKQTWHALALFAKQAGKINGECTPGFKSVCARKFAPLLTSFRLKSQPQTPPWFSKAKFGANSGCKGDRQSWQAGPADGKSEKGCGAREAHLWLVPGSCYYVTTCLLLMPARLATPQHHECEKGRSPLRVKAHELAS